MITFYGRFWWSFFFRGIIATLFGLAAIILPGITLELLALLLAVFLITDGVFSFLASLGGRGTDPQWWLLLLEGLAGIFIGILAIARPGLTVLAVMLIIAFWALLTGFLEIMAAIRLRHDIQGEWMLGLAGILSILFGIILLSNPGAGAVILVWLVGIYALIFGISMILLGLKLRKFTEDV
jgi:uncharacterized membrane protein HdeD (DUF308 family)